MRSKQALFAPANDDCECGGRAELPSGGDESGHAHHVVDCLRQPNAFCRGAMTLLVANSNVIGPTPVAP
jgi:hypothetical protein